GGNLRIIRWFHLPITYRCDLLITCFSGRLGLVVTGTSRADNDDCCHDNDHNSYGADQAYTTSYLLYLGEVVVQKAAGKVAKDAVNGCPHNTTGCIIDEEGAPVHVVNTGQKCSPGSQHGNEAT